ncbi:MAG: T9SS type A sorting domain-containing protein [Bacteroidetes bacterium]|nr:T9SS type A sorting domain-containing protein [Bacteroidota bacterium]
MKRSTYFITFLLPSLLLAAFIFSAYTSGAPSGYSGSPFDGKSCTYCHSGTATTVTGWISSNIPASGYVPGTTYQITASNGLTGSGKLGFEVSPQNAAGTLLGTLAAGTGSKLVGSGKYITQMSATSSTSSWTFSWTAPVAGTGNVTFYGAFARNKPGPVSVTTYTVSESTTGIDGANTSTAGLLVYPNPAREVIHIQLPDAASGGVSVHLFNMAGQQMQVTSQLSSNNMVLETSSLPKGMYLLYVVSGDSKVTKKIVVE